MKKPFCVKDKLKSSVWKKCMVAILGGIVGFVNGMLGGGGGSLVVPLYQSALDMETKHAHANAIVTILPLCLVSGIIYMLRGETDYVSLGYVSLGVVVGGVVGAVLLKKLSSSLLSGVFYVIMLYAGIRSIVG